MRSEIDWNINNVIFWTDSTTVLQYINNESRRFHGFVATRLEEIHEYTKPEQWRNVSEKLNPVNEGSRGLPIEAFLSNCRWWSGPEFLYKDTDQWPELKIAEIPDDDQEVLKKRVCKGTSTSDSAFSLLLQKCVSWLIRFVQFNQSQP